MNDFNYYMDQAHKVLFQQTGAFMMTPEHSEESVASLEEKHMIFENMIAVPIKNSYALIQGLEDCCRAAIATDLKENGKKEVIKRTLSERNKDKSITESTFEFLQMYDITKDEILEIYLKFDW